MTTYDELLRSLLVERFAPSPTSGGSSKAQSTHADVLDLEVRRARRARRRAREQPTIDTTRRTS